MKKDQRGLDGVISFEGIAFGIAGSMIISLVYCFLTHWSLQAFLIIIFAGTIGNLADSYLGATVERKEVIGNDLVNFLNTVIAILAAYLLTQLL